MPGEPEQRQARSFIGCNRDVQNLLVLHFFSRPFHSQCCRVPGTVDFVRLSGLEARVSGGGGGGVPSRSCPKLPSTKLVFGLPRQHRA